MKSLNKYITILFLTSLSSIAFSAADVQIRTEALIEVEVVTEEGEIVLIREAAVEVDANSELIFILTVINSGDEAATKLNVDNPVPNGATYLANTALGESSDITVSHEGEKYVSEQEFVNGEFTVSDINFLRWTIKSLGAGETKALEFRVLIK